MPSIAIIGASTDKTKFSNKCVRAYLHKGWTVYPIHPKETVIEAQKAYPGLSAIAAPIDRVALYVGPQIGIGQLEAVAAKKPKDLIVNPGTESPELIAKARELKINAVQTCAIRDIGADPDTL